MTTPLEDQLRERIRREGPLSFRAVMQAALYHPEHGYYTNLKGFGAEGDFITSPERDPAFGWLLGRQALDVWEALEKPLPFRILELGAGSGALAESLLGFRRHEVPEIVYTLAETSPSLRAVQQQRLLGPPLDSRGMPGDGSDHVRVTPDDRSELVGGAAADRRDHVSFRWEGAEEPAHFIIANEVADALPVHRVVMRQGLFHELCVGLDEHARLTWVETPEAPPAIDAYFADLHYHPPEGTIADVCLDLADWVRGVTRRLDRGVALVMDYSTSPPRDTLLTYYRHTLGSDPFVRLGQQDISAHVDLRTLVRLAIAEGVKAGATAQRGLLFNLGFQQVVARLSGPTDRAALAQLVDADGAGGQIAAVFLVRGLADYKPVGATSRDWPEPIGVPSLPPDVQESDFLSQWREAFP